MRRWFVDEEGVTALTVGLFFGGSFIFVVAVLAVACKYVLSGLL